MAGAAIVFGGYWFLDRKLRLQERGERAQQAEAERRRNREAVLRSVHRELESNAAQLTTALEAMPEGGITYPLFDVTLWPVISSPVIFTTLDRGTIDALTHTYNRMATANEQNAFLSDLNHGPTAILAASTASLSIGDPRVKETYDTFLAHREEVRKGVIERLNDLKPHLDLAIDAVEKEVGIVAQLPAAQRVYQPDTPVGFIGDNKTLPPPPQSPQ